jgi:hypothetical protein
VFKNNSFVLQFDTTDLQVGLYSFDIILKDPVSTRINSYKLDINLVQEETETAAFVPVYDVEEAGETSKKVVQSEWVDEDAKEERDFFPVKIWIERMSRDGTLTIKFNQDLVVPDLDEIDDGSQLGVG